MSNTVRECDGEGVREQHRECDGEGATQRECDGEGVREQHRERASVTVRV